MRLIKEALLVVCLVGCGCLLVNRFPNKREEPAKPTISQEEVEMNASWKAIYGVERETAAPTVHAAMSIALGATQTKAGESIRPKAAND